MTRIHAARPLFGLLAAAALATGALAHGDVTPRPVDTGALPAVSED
jgi:hypothetical protein